MSAHRLFLSVGLAGLAAAAWAWQRPTPVIATAAMDDHIMGMTGASLAAPRIVARAATQGTAGLPPSASTAAARLAASPRHAEWVKIPWGSGSTDSLMAWIVYPVTSRPHTPVVVVVHEIFGLSTWVRSVADQVAADGFIAIAPDLVSRVRGGPSADELPSDSAVKLIRGVTPAERSLGVTAAARFAMSQPSAAQRYGVIGFCWGGSTTWMYAINQGVTGFSSGVAFYGLPYMNGAAPDADSLSKIRVPVMLLNGSKDARIGAAMPALDSIMRALHKDYSGSNYENAIHGFVRAQDDPRTPRDSVVEAANLAALKDAWPRTTTFLRKHLGLD
jgi:carboxymethylenebutenolidase